MGGGGESVNKLGDSDPSAIYVKVHKVTVTNCFNLPKVRKVTKVTCPNLVKLTSDLVAFNVNPTT